MRIKRIIGCILTIALMYCAFGTIGIHSGLSIDPFAFAEEQSSGSYIELKKGDSGDEVTKLQMRLHDLGYSVGTIDGQFGTNTFRAIAAFQNANGISQSGIADDQTQCLLFAEPTLPSGFYRSDESFLRDNVIMRYQMNCYFSIKDEIYSSSYMVDAIKPIDEDKVVSDAKKQNYECDCNYMGAGKFHCKVSYTDMISHSSEELSFDVYVDGGKLKIESLLTTESTGCESITEGYYSRIE